jgi:hydrogenase nickel incorporation protein HypA/HybF
MHELSLVQEIIRIAGERAQGARVRRVVVEVGRLAAVAPGALRFCFELAAEGTRVEGAALELVEVPGQGRCSACGANVTLRSPLDACGCGAGAPEWLSGDGLSITQLEVI